MEGKQTEIRKITINSKEYPKRLKKLSGMPKELYVIGNLPEDNAPTAAVVGARMCSAYGKRQAHCYAKVLAEYGIQVISGMALGIDTQGHLGALEAQRPTYAVLGSGVDVCYPAANRIRSWKPEEGSSVNFLPGCRQRQDIFLQETGSSVLWLMWC